MLSDFANLYIQYFDILKIIFSIGMTTAIVFSLLGQLIAVTAFDDELFFNFICSTSSSFTITVALGCLIGVALA